MQAYPQAVLNDPVYMRLPQGWRAAPDGTLQPHWDPKFHDTTHYIQLKCNLYGCKQAAHNWFQHLNQGILAEGFQQSKIDPSIINDLIKNLSQTFLLEDQGSVHDYLGISITSDTNTKTITMTQTGLIESTIVEVGLTLNSNTKTTPTDSILYPDTGGSPRQEFLNYRSVMGKLNFLAQNTHPDISMYVDANFSGMWHRKYSALQENILSRTGYIITSNPLGIQVTKWNCFKHHREWIHCSQHGHLRVDTFSLAFARDSPPRIHDPTIWCYLQHYPHTNSFFYQHFWRQGCLYCSWQKVHMKHIGLKWHHFKDQIKQGLIRVIKIDTHVNWADILTKHETFCKLIMGW